ncbi:hypothetical protein [Chitinophaga varians]|uniref:hypothetical protein n=1 Tax=Chitinophaga varians TaxID=2202339 RepID=UPI00165FE749|nr:hypothetical protein [Chitinophaga varians]MBC9914758.1 hypothetical protein [Chitinophaga varians]
MDSMEQRMDSLEKKVDTLEAKVEMRFSVVDLRFEALDCVLNNIREDIGKMAEWVPFRTPPLAPVLRG